MDLFYPSIILVLLYMSLTLYKYISEWKKRLLLENELKIAKKIQESFLPKSIPRMDGLEIEATMFTAREVGGDLYDFRAFDDGTLGVMIGDVSGKGVPASLFMAMVTSEFKFFAMPGAPPEAVLTGLNSKLVKESSSNLFVTVFYLIFDMKSGRSGSQRRAPARNTPQRGGGYGAFDLSKARLWHSGLRILWRRAAV